jgi:hypothetical protein
MFLFERRDNSFLSPLGEAETAAAWGMSDDPIDMQPQMRYEAGILAGDAQPPRVRGYNSKEPLIPVIGSLTMIDGSDDDYYRTKFLSNSSSPDSSIDLV